MVDCFLYGERQHALPSNVETVRGDLRDSRLVHEAVEDSDAVVHLAGIVGEPACAVDPYLAIELNVGTALIAAEACRRIRHPNFVFISTCSVYGTGVGTVDERDKPQPIGTYAATKLYAEQRIGQILRNGRLTILRPGTAFGISPRMRLDSVLNRMTVDALNTGTITVSGRNRQRPLVHVTDISRAIAAAIQRLDDGQRIWNVGTNRNNFSILQIAQIVRGSVPEADIVEDTVDKDKRDYSVDFGLIESAIPPNIWKTPKEGVEEICQALNTGSISDPDSIIYNNQRALQREVSEGRLSPLRSEKMDATYQAYMAGQAGEV